MSESKKVWVMLVAELSQPAYAAAAYLDEATAVVEAQRKVEQLRDENKVEEGDDRVFNIVKIDDFAWVLKFGKRDVHRIMAMVSLQLVPLA